MDRLMRAEAAQRKLRKRVHKHKKATREARWDTDEAYTALGALQTQMEWVDQQRVAVQEARADDQAMLARLQEHLEAACTEAFTATCQRILANNNAALVEAARNRVEAKATQQACIEWDLHHQLAHTQNMVVDLQHEVHFLNNQLHPILDEEEVELEDEDNVISDLDSKHAED